MTRPPFAVKERFSVWSVGKRRKRKAKCGGGGRGGGGRVGGGGREGRGMRKAQGECVTFEIQCLFFFFTTLSFRVQYFEGCHTFKRLYLVYWVNSLCVSVCLSVCLSVSIYI